MFFVFVTMFESWDIPTLFHRPYSDRRYGATHKGPSEGLFPLQGNKTNNEHILLPRV
jgi:hypothetical protein